MVKQIRYNSYTLEDPIVSDSINAVQSMKDEDSVKGHIAGGMGVQSYIPSDFHRKTIDLDFSTMWQGSASEFRELTAPIRTFLEEKGYNVDLKKSHLTYDHYLSKKDDSFMIQHRRESKCHFDRVTKKTIEREVANHHTINRNGLTYEVLSPEDLAVHKLNRAGIFSNSYSLEKPRISSISKFLERLNYIRDDLISRFDDVSPEEIANLRLFCDLFDVKCLSEFAGFDKSYFNEVVKDYKDISGINPDNLYRSLDRLEVGLK